MLEGLSILHKVFLPHTRRIHNVTKQTNNPPAAPLQNVTF